ncbi:unnamed protein product [Mycena citricolor]|uniref:Uncharacterized protein n=1 Tax=Mycena citricolor TaxID=2018698 RepID=A0AAD2HD41_9AGAR|nr:unnamed protein product [Mycena citricolor]
MCFQNVPILCASCIAFQRKFLTWREKSRDRIEAQTWSAVGPACVPRVYSLDTSSTFRRVAGRTAVSFWARIVARSGRVVARRRGRGGVFARAACLAAVVVWERRVSSAECFPGMPKVVWPVLPLISAVSGRSMSLSGVVFHYDFHICYPVDSFQALCISRVLWSEPNCYPQSG